MNLNEVLFDLSYEEFVKKHNDNQLLFELEKHFHTQQYINVALYYNGICQSCKKKCHVETCTSGPDYGMLYLIDRNFKQIIPDHKRFTFVCQSCYNADKPSPLRKKKLFVANCAGHSKLSLTQKMINKHGLICYYCQVETVYIVKSSIISQFHNAATVDHKHPRSKGGTNRRSNLVIACITCNNAKSSMSEEEFRSSDKLKKRIEEIVLLKKGMSLINNENISIIPT